MILDYRQISCGCCTGKTKGAGPNWRTAEDQCVCAIHQRYWGDARTCSAHAPRYWPHHYMPACRCDQCQDAYREALDREKFGRLVHPIGCICEGCSATYERERMDPRG